MGLSLRFFAFAVLAWLGSDPELQFCSFRGGRTNLQLLLDRGKTAAKPSEVRIPSLPTPMGGCTVLLIGLACIDSGVVAIGEFRRGHLGHACVYFVAGMRNSGMAHTRFCCVRIIGDSNASSSGRHASLPRAQRGRPSRCPSISRSLLSRA